jgi:hypothetical protein
LRVILQARHRTTPFAFVVAMQPATVVQYYPARKP